MEQKIKPAYFFGKGITKVTVWTEEGTGKVYPEATGSASKKLHEECRNLGGRVLSFSNVFAMLKDLL